ncbi:velvet factor-domain-containing protein [Trametes polyzona]|nr:velvet factor-domain-containing protein [Trametes polyzona]
MSAPHSDWYPKPRSVEPGRGLPTFFDTGVLAGLTVRAEIEEIQKADLGRKYARKDKRPLDPPPVVHCRFFKVINQGLHNVREQELDVTRASLGAVCHIDLFPVPEEFDQYCHPPQPGASPKLPFSTPYQPVAQSTQASSLAGLILPPPTDIMTGIIPPMSYNRGLPPPPFTVPYYASGPIPYPQAPIAALHSSAGLGPTPYGQATMLPGSTKCTSVLAGATFTQAEVLNYKGKNAAMFVYSDLAVKVEGTFVLRYRATHISPRLNPGDFSPVLAECYGGPFKVYSTKEFPGLRPSTSLTKLLSMHNIRVNMRETERERGKKSRTSAEDDEDEDEDEEYRRDDAGSHGYSVHHPSHISGSGGPPPSPYQSTLYSPTTSVASTASNPGPSAWSTSREKGKSSTRAGGSKHSGGKGKRRATE